MPLLPLLLAACHGKSPGDSETGAALECDLVEASSVVTTGEDGSARVSVALAEGDLELQVRAVREDVGATTIDDLQDADGAVIWDGEDWMYDNENLTNAAYATNAGSVLDWPARGSDTPLGVGEWSASVSAWNPRGNAQADQEIQVESTVRRCTADELVLPVTLVFTGGVEGDGDVYPAIEDALATWRDRYADVGITLDVTETTSDLDPTLVNPWVGDDAYTELYTTSGERGLVMVVGETIADFDGYYGYTGNIPGPSGAQPDAAVVLAWLELAGPDGVFSDDEVATMARSMQHEAGHYLGLMHVVETSWTWFDALEDTEECSGQSNCERTLSSNLMFPWIDELEGEITEEQRAMMRNWIVLE